LHDCHRAVIADWRRVVLGKKKSGAAEQKQDGQKVAEKVSLHNLPLKGKQLIVIGFSRSRLKNGLIARILRYCAET
jgi:hypothetical protein